jgi:hypothetical protein
MPILQVRELPEPIYNKLKQKAKREHRSLSQQAIIELATALEISPAAKDRRIQAIQAINELQKRFSFNVTKEPAELVREDRGR